MGKTVNIRVSKKEKKRLAKQAELNGQTLSEFLRSSAVKEAHRVLGPPKPILAGKP